MRWYALIGQRGQRSMGVGSKTLDDNGVELSEHIHRHADGDPEGSYQLQHFQRVGGLFSGIAMGR